jgi:glyoxylase-like metal-dependent hydrolase (beta-lactamase superfamily II)
MQVIPNVHRIPGLRGANVYLLLGPTHTLVDTGMQGNAKVILNYMDGLGPVPLDLGRIVITHHHIDHAGSLAALGQQTGAPVVAHPADAPFIAGELPQPPPGSALLRLLLFVASAISHYEPSPVDTHVKDGDYLDVLGGATVVHTPGHTPGSIALHLPTEGLLICGDAITRRGNRLGPPPGPLTEDMEQAIVSLRRLAELDFEVLCPGHGDPIVGGADEQVRAMVGALV